MDRVSPAFHLLERPWERSHSQGISIYDHNVGSTGMSKDDNSELRRYDRVVHTIPLLPKLRVLMTQAKDDDTRSRKVYPPLSFTRDCRGFSAHPLLRLAGQPIPRTENSTLPRTVGYARVRTRPSKPPRIIVNAIKNSPTFHSGNARSVAKVACL